MLSLSNLEVPIILKNAVAKYPFNLVLSDEEFKDRIDITLPFLKDYNLQNIVLVGSAVYANIKYENALDAYYMPINSVSMYVVDANFQVITNLLCDYLYKYWTSEGLTMTITRTSKYYSFKNNAIIADEVIIYTDNIKSISELLELKSTGIDCYGCVWDGKQIYMTNQAKKSFETNSIIFKNDYNYTLSQLNSISLLFIRGINIILTSLDDLYEFKINGLKEESTILATANSIYVKNKIPSYLNPLAKIEYDGIINIHTIQPTITIDALLQAIKIEDIISKNLTFEEIQGLKKEIEPILEKYVTIINDKLFFV